MRWTPEGRSSDLEDRRGEGGGGGFGRPVGIGGALIAIVLSLVFGRNVVIDNGGPDTGTAPGAYPTGGPTTSVSNGGLSPADSAREEPEVQFVSFVLDDVQKTWERVLSRDASVPYRHAKLVLFRDGTTSGCGPAASAMGPFYCPVDQKVYLDLGFFDELRTRFRAAGEFAEAYVIAHELGHHVQHLLGTDLEVRRLQRADPSAANPLSVRLELQADCYAGVWAHTTEERRLLEQGDVESAMSAAAAVGDDRIQRQATGRVNVDAFTHGSSAQRVSWFTRGLRSGRPEDCDTFRDRSR